MDSTPVHEGHDLLSRIGVYRLNVRHIARLRSQDEKSHLDVTNVQAMTMCEEREEAPSSLLVRIEARPDSTNAPGGRVASWYEASVSSARADDLFRQNETLRVGDEPDWTVERLQEAGVFRDLYGPAAAMVKRMDGVGVLGDNGQGERLSRAPGTRGAAADALKGAESPRRSFW